MARPRSIRYKLNWVVLATTFVALSLAGLAMVIYDLRSYQRTWERDLLTQADLLGLATAPALSFNDPKTARENLALLKARPNILGAAIYTPDGRLFASYGAGANAGAGPANGADGVRVDGGDLVAFKTIVNEGERLGAVHLRARHEKLDHLQQYLMVVALVIAGSLALALLLSNRLLSVVTRPLLAVSDVARRITAGRDYSLRATRTTDDEVGEVVDAFNGMLVELARRAEVLEQANQQTLALNAELEDRVRRRTSQLEIANLELEAFSYSASHDLRAPLHAIDSFSNLLEKSVREHLDDRGRHFINRIQVNARLMAKLIDALLTLAHVSRATLEREQVDLTALAAEALQRCREQEPHRVAVIDVAPGMHALADTMLVNQVVQNLVGNAWKFTSKEAVAHVTIGCEASAGRPATFFVRDNGAGFDMAYADKLFNAFQRLHSPHEFPGTGIGLATVQKIVSRHEGKIWAESAPGQGATFYFTLESAPADD
ncbi:ATP-binding protein [Ramlibacter sp. WS9]|uniref:ATP-binding protein n=1 Tax=Ramlibacter sp. WS9 TaxID=1882741 RepID=UPI001144B2AD|nr:ATP-binding protein [Ramlibacter sp. WS9]ROZ78896.1 HAMP domain-containing protein [Ramlibacter sp. WS9]